MDMLAPGAQSECLGVTSIKEVNHCMADDLIAEGYEIHKVYQKGNILIKRAESA
jgi:hypothetical protein